MAESSSSRAFLVMAELIVIVVGVLTALAVDEWRVSVAESELRAQYTAGLIEDIELELSYLDLLEDRRRDRLAAADRVLLALGSSAGPSIPRLAYEAPPSFDAGSLSRDLESAMEFQFFVPEAVVWEDLS